jgi:ketosteroid isomerase-like protein
MVKELYAAFGRGDMPAMLRVLDDDIQWNYPGSDLIPWAGSFRGHDGVQQVFAAIASQADIERFEPQRFLAQDDSVVVLGWERVRVKRTSRTFEAHWTHAYTLSRGKVTTFREYTDTAATESAFRS